MAIDRWTSGAHYEQWMGRWSRLLAAEFLNWLKLPSGLQWLDVCCGSGILSATIAEQNQPDSVIGVDLSAAQIEFARQQRARRNIRFEVADAMSLPFTDSSFDAAVCGLGLNFIPDPVRALRELRRVVRPRGTIAAYVWDYAQGARFLREFWDAAMAIDPEAATLDQARRFTICTKETLRLPFERGQLEDITVHGLEIITRFSGFDDYWSPLLTGQGSAPAYVATLDEASRDAIRERLRENLPMNGEGAIELPARAWAVRAHRKE
jgi:ubiquinone/menaquinone biosynthesis C-methylase UbiE